MEDYIKQAVRSESPADEAMTNRIKEKATMRLIHAGFGLATEVGEFLDGLKKYVFYNKEPDRDNLVEELGDLMWYMAIAADVLGVSFDRIMQANIDKLRARYPKQFTEKDAVNRDLEKEAAAMQQPVQELCPRLEFHFKYKNSQVVFDIFIEAVSDTVAMQKAIETLMPSHDWWEDKPRDLSASLHKMHRTRLELVSARNIELGERKLT